VSFREHAERFGVQMHIVDEGAVDIEDDGAWSEAERHN
jgi:hypothetical protein